jgi:hypothetical protein
VQAAHETPDGAQPLRMMELWEAIELSLTPDNYARLLDEPAKVADELIDLGVKKIQEGLTSSAFEKKQKYGDIKTRQDTYIDNFKRDAKTFLIEFAAQIPKGTFANPTLDDTGKPRKDAPVSEVAGIMSGKFMGGVACKAGLWWAKNENKPVYYCLDGINMDDVTSYKKVKNKAIEDFIAAAASRPAPRATTRSSQWWNLGKS